jgi:hypothetical protein
MKPLKSYLVDSSPAHHVWCACAREIMRIASRRHSVIAPTTGFAGPAADKPAMPLVRTAVNGTATIAFIG